MQIRCMFLGEIMSRYERENRIVAGSGDQDRRLGIVRLTDDQSDTSKYEFLGGGGRGARIATIAMCQNENHCSFCQKP